MARFVLPKSQYATRWVHSTDALRAYLQERLKGIADRATAKRKEADAIEAEGQQIEQAIAFLDQMLPRKSEAMPKPEGHASPGTVTRQESAGEVKSGLRFSLMYERCTKCDRGPADGVRHSAKGLCQACYWNETHQKVTEETPAVASMVNGQ